MSGTPSSSPRPLSFPGAAPHAATRTSHSLHSPASPPARPAHRSTHPPHPAAACAGSCSPPAAPQHSGCCCAGRPVGMWSMAGRVWGLAHLLAQARVTSLQLHSTAALRHARGHGAGECLPLCTPPSLHHHSGHLRWRAGRAGWSSGRR